MNRPKKNTQIITTACQEMAQHLKNWTNINIDTAKLTNHLLKICENTTNFDGYHLAKKLEYRSYCKITSETVEALDSMHAIISTHLRRAVQKWVNIQNIKPKYTMGQNIIIPEQTIYINKEDKIQINKDELYGTIIDINGDQATYDVNIPSLAHVKPGNLGTQAISIPYEQLHPQHPNTLTP